MEIENFWWDYRIMKRKMNCPKCGGTGKHETILHGKCDECGGRGEIIIEDNENLE